MSEEQNKKEAVKFKDSGNEFYKKREYGKAIELYTKAIELDPSQVTFFGNRSAAKQMAGKVDDCVDDCVKALQVDPTFAKCAIRGYTILMDDRALRTLFVPLQRQ